ncbi:hypothetical protein JXL19_05275 [bacterium]|nr:hypothetical protein [bacterium]
MNPVKTAVLSMIVFLCFSAFLSKAQVTGDGSECLGCHQNVSNQAGIYRHLPFAQNKCPSCHLVSEGISETEDVIEPCTRDGIGRNDLGITTCYKCHSKEKLGVSHPVGVFPSENIKVPDVLPRGTEGRLLCISCHCQHVSDEEYLGRKPVSAQLCIACHGIDYFK